MLLQAELAEQCSMKTNGGVIELSRLIYKTLGPPPVPVSFCHSNLTGNASASQNIYCEAHDAKSSDSH